jgi:hypothetical protein
LEKAIGKGRLIQFKKHKNKLSHLLMQTIKQSVIHLYAAIGTGKIIQDMAILSIAILAVILFIGMAKSIIALIALSSCDEPRTLDNFTRTPSGV